MVLALLLAATPVFAEEFVPPPKDGLGVIGGRGGQAWRLGIFDTLKLNGVTYAYPSADGTNGQVLATDGSGTLAWAASGASTAWDDIADPDAAGTVAMTTYAQTLTATKTDGDMFTIKGLGAFADVSVVRIESSVGNPTDGTILEVVSHDANADPLVVSSSAQAGAFSVNQDGTVTMVGAASAGALATTGVTTIGDGSTTAAVNSTGWAVSTTGTATGIASVGFDSLSTLQSTSITLTAAEVKALRASPKQVLAAAGADKIIELASATLILNYGSEVFTETADNLVLEYADGRDITAAIETTGFIDQTADQVAIVQAADIPTFTATAAVNKKIQLFNTGDGEIAGNASNDSTLTLKLTYWVHTAGL
jgi:hypothetical protein